MLETARQACEDRSEPGRVRVHGKNRLMILTAAGKQRSHSRGSYALPDIAREIDQTGSSIAFFRGHTHIRSHGKWNEQKSNRQILPNSHPCGRLKADEQINMFAREIHGYGKRDPAESKKEPGLKVPCE